MHSLATAALLLTTQMPQACLGVKDLASGPFCATATFSDHLEQIATTKRSAADSVTASAARGNLQELLTTVAYWQLERGRVARSVCSDLDAFNWNSDSTSQGLPREVCTFLEGMVASDSIAFADAAADLEDPTRLTLTQRATRDAKHKQATDNLSRGFFAAALGFTFLLTTTNPTDTTRLALNLNAVEKRWLIGSFRRAEGIGEAGGVFSQVGKAIADWLAKPWPLARH